MDYTGILRLRIIKCSAVVLLLTALALPLAAQTAKESFIRAKHEVESGNYKGALSNLQDCEDLLNGSNARIEGLRVLCYAMINDWVHASIAYNSYMAFLPESARSGEAYEEVQRLKRDIDVGLAAAQRDFEKSMEEEAKRKMEQVVQQEDSFMATQATRREQLEESSSSRVRDLALQSRNKDLLSFYDRKYKAVGKDQKVSEELARHADPNRFIFEAVSKRDIKEVKYLLGVGADINYVDKSSGKSLLHEAIAVKDANMLQALIDNKPSFETRNKDGETPSLFAIKTGFERGFFMLKNSGSRINTTNNENEPALLYAIVHERAFAIEPLLQNGANVNERWTYRKTTITPLYVAVYYTKSAPMVRLLIKNNARINDVSNESWTPLMAAIYDNNEEMIHTLLEYQPNLDTKGPHGWTALHFAARSNFVAGARLLVDHGASKNIRDEHGRTPKRLAREHENDQVRKVL